MGKGSQVVKETGKWALIYRDEVISIEISTNESFRQYTHLRMYLD